MALAPLTRAFNDAFDFDFGFGPSRSQRQYLSPEEEESLLAELGGFARGGLGFVADVLDTPGSILRGLIAGENPLPGIFDVSQRTSVEDLTGSDNFFTNLGAGIALDPLTYLTFGGSAVAKHGAGGVARAAGLLDDAARVAGTGKRVARMRTSLDDLIAGAVDPAAAQQSAMHAAEGLGVDLADVGSQKLGGLVGVGLPFMDPITTLGTGATAQKYGGALDRLGEKVAYSAPGRFVSQLFDPQVRGTSSEPVQRALRGRAEDFASGRQEAIAGVSEPLQRLIDAGKLDDSTASSIVRGIEGWASPVDPVVRSVVDDLSANLYEMPMRKHELGLPSNIHIDPAAEMVLREPGVMGPQRTPYFPHVLSDTRAAGQVGKKALNTFDPFEQQRDLTGIIGGREQIRDIVRDPAVYGAATPDDTLKAIEASYGDLFVGPNAQSTMKHLSGSVRDLQPDQAAAGMFGNHPLVDMQSRLLIEKEAEVAASTIYDVLAKQALDPAALPPGHNSVRVADVLRGAKLGEGSADWGAIKQLGDRLGGVPSNIMEWRVPTEISEDIGRMMKGFTAPEEAMNIVKGLDSFLNLFKAGVLSWPARHTRDFVSGQWNNVVTGEWSLDSLQNTYKLLKGGTIDDAMHYPIVRDLLTQRGVAPTPENATGIVRQIIMENELLRAHSAKQGDVVGAAANATTGSIDELLGVMPGAKPAPTIAGILKQAVPRSLEEANPMNIRGVGGRMDTQFAWAKASENAGWLTDSMNRVAPFLNQLSRGVDPRTAAVKVLASQVDYSARAFTPFEKTWMKRLFPFYSFTKGMVPFVFRQLWEKPGGRLAQTIRATDQLSGSEDWLPDWISNTAAIPLGEEGEGGKQRYLTGLGLMHEDVLSLFRPGVDSYHTVQNFGQELLGRSNPLIKGPVEFTAGRQFYTGRELEDLDSSIGRTIQNVAGTEYPPEIPILLDQMLSNSPLARVASTARTLTDPRKEPWAKAVNLFTGARLTDVDMDMQRSVQSREILEDILRSDPAVRSFEHIYVSPEDEARLSPSELQAMNLYRTLSRQAQQTARQKKTAQPTLYDLLAP